MAERPTFASVHDAEIEALLQWLAVDPGNLEVHRELRTTALKRKAEGGPPAPAAVRAGRPLPDSRGRLIHVERCWSFDPANLDRLLAVIRAVEACAAEQTEIDFRSVLDWLRRIGQATRGGT